MEIIIQPHRGFFELDFRELWSYRDLYTLFVKRDLITQYKQTILGPVWFIVQPALTTALYIFVFGGIAGISTDGLPKSLFYLSGIVCWQYFADSIQKTASTFITHQAIFGKVYFPRLLVPLASVSSNLIRMGIHFILFWVVYVFYVLSGVQVKPTIYVLLFPLLLVLLAGLSLGFGILVASLTVRYRDLTNLVGFFIQLWMYSTPVIYPLSTLPEQYSVIVTINPVTPVVETFRLATMGVGMLNWNSLIYSFTLMVVLLGLSVLVFNKVQRTFMDTV